LISESEHVKCLLSFSCLRARSPSLDINVSLNDRLAVVGQHCRKGAHHASAVGSFIVASPWRSTHAAARDRRLISTDPGKGDLIQQSTPPRHIFRVFFKIGVAPVRHVLEQRPPYKAAFPLRKRIPARRFNDSFAVEGETRSDRSFRFPPLDQ
jgi:hypothetical protein